MPNSGLHGPYRLDPENIDQMVPRVSPGAYALGTERGATFYVACVGRADADIASELRARVGSYVHFKFRYFDTAQAAFERECQLYHDFGPTGLHDPAHPARGANSAWRCPRCDVFG